MAVKLEYYQIDPASKNKTKITSALSFGNMFKGTNKKIPITIFNAGDTEAVSPVISIKEYPDGNSQEPYKWKKVSFDEHKNYTTSLSLPNIKPGDWLEGETVQFEDFNNYPVVAGTKPDQSWLLWEGGQFAWEVYNGWLQHNIDSIDGRALWTELSTAKDFTFSMKVTIRDGIYGGLILRDEGDSNTGYIVLVQAMPEHLGNVMRNEAVIQVFSGKFTDGIDSWRELYKSPTVGQRGTHDYFKVRLEGNRFDFWYNNEKSETPLYSFTDTENLHTKPSKPIICVHAGLGSAKSYFDDVRMSVVNKDGVVWIENSTDKDTKIFGTQYSVLNVEYGGVE